MIRAARAKSSRQGLVSSITAAIFISSATKEASKRSCMCCRSFREARPAGSTRRNLATARRRSNSTESEPTGGRTPSVLLVFLGGRGDPFAQHGRDAACDQVDGAHQLGVRQRSAVHHERDAGDAAQGFAVSQDLLGHLVGGADQKRAVWRELSVELGAGDGTPPALFADGGKGAGVSGEEVVRGLLGRRRDVAKTVDTDLQSIG